VALPKPLLSCNKCAFVLSTQYGISVNGDRMRRLALSGRVPAELYADQLGFDPAKLPEIAERARVALRITTPPALSPTSRPAA
jgi:hypothetical protein